MKQEEKLYYSQLAAMIRDEKQNRFLFNRGHIREMDLNMILTHIQSKYPSVYKKICSSSYLDFTRVQGRKISLQEVLSVMHESKKGTVLRWKDEKGRDFYFVNYGTDPLNKKKKIRIMSGTVNLRDLKRLQQKLIRQTVQRDIHRIYDRMYRQQRSGRKQVRIRHTLNSYERKTAQLPTAGSFEKMFMKAVKENRNGDVMDISTSLFTLMDKRNKISYSKDLFNKGIRTGSDYRTYLENLRAKTLGIVHSQEKNRSVSRQIYSHER
jgi:hypothetical protein